MEPELENREALLQEYLMNVELWQHEDDIKQARIDTFLKVNGILGVGFGALTSLGPDLVQIAGASLALSAFALFICKVWTTLMLRTSEYQRFRRSQLRELEARLAGSTGLSTWQRSWNVFVRSEPVAFPTVGEEFAIHEDGRTLSSLTEGRLPQILGFVWSAIAMAAIGALIYSGLT